jgi:hypothetical protein
VVNYTVRGVPEEDNAYELSLVNLRPLSPKRVAGGTRVLLGELERDSLVLFTQDATVIRALGARLNQTRRRAAELAREIAAADQIDLEVATERLSAVGHEIPATRPLRIAVQSDLRQYESLAAKGDPAAAYYQARHALATLRLIERAHFDKVAPDAASLGDPWACHFTTLADHVRFRGQLASAPRSASRLVEGECEDLARMIQSGWKHFRHPQPNITTTVDLSPQAAHSGRAGLRLRAVAANPKDQPSAVESPPMWVTTAAVGVETGQLIEIQAWVRVARPITGSVDGLLVIDTLTGQALAQRPAPTSDWQQLTVYRGAAQSGPMTVTFALAGLGEVWIDDVSVRLVSRPGGAPPPQALRMQSPQSNPLTNAQLTGG